MKEMLDKHTREVEHWQALGYVHVVKARENYTFAGVVEWMNSQGISCYRYTWGFFFFKRENEAFAFKMRWG